MPIKIRKHQVDRLYKHFDMSELPQQIKYRQQIQKDPQLQFC